MKPILLLAFLAVGPALADQLPVTAPASSPIAELIAPTAANAPAIDAAARAGEHIWLCGR